MNADPQTLFQSPSPAYTQEFIAINLAIRLASDRIRQLFYEGLLIHTKPDGSPVTNADLEVDRILREVLLGAFPKDGWLSEEGPDHPARHQYSRVWILDPIDGTRPFTKLLPQFTISLALIDQGRHALGVIVNPATQEYFWAVGGSGAYLNGKPLSTTAQTAPGSQADPIRPTFLVSPGSLPRTILNEWKKIVHCPFILGSIAYSLAMVAAGRVHGVINLGNQNEWDIAAGTLLIQEAGGIILDRHQRPIVFNQSHPVVDGTIAAHPRTFSLMQTLLQSVSSI